MVESGIVKKVDKKIAWVTVVRGDQCGSCNACKSFDEGHAEILAINEIAAKNGDKVEVEIDAGQVVRHSIIVFLLPVFALVFGYFLGANFLSKIGISTEAAGIFGSLSFMIICFIVIIGYDRLIAKSNEINAKIVRIL